MKRPCSICKKEYEIDMLISFYDGEVCEYCYEKGYEEPDPPDSANFYARGGEGGFESSASYRADMRLAGRGHLLRD
jgi:hypothetical protein